MKLAFKGLVAAALLGLTSLASAATVHSTLTISNNSLPQDFYAGFDADDLTVYVPFEMVSSGGVSVAFASFQPANMTSFTLYTWDGAAPDAYVASGTQLPPPDDVSGPFHNWSLTTFLTAGNYVLEFVRVPVLAGENIGSVQGNISAAPLPGAALLFGSALLGAGVIGRKKLARQKNEAVSA